MKKRESIIAANTLHTLLNDSAAAMGIEKYFGTVSNVPNTAAISRKSEVIVCHQLFQRISFANGFVARISSFPVSIYEFKVQI